MYLETCTFASSAHLEFQLYLFSVMTDTILSHVSDAVMQTLSQLCLLSTYCSALQLSTSPLLHKTQTIYLCFSCRISNQSICHDWHLPCQKCQTPLVIALYFSNKHFTAFSHVTPSGLKAFNFFFF